jgi:ribonuclease BN (tRNA processing enzyme)
MIKIKPLGVNGAFTKYFHNNYVFELGDRKLLVDAGTTLRYSLQAAEYKESDITDIVITHLHSDHVGGLEEFAQRCKWIYNHKPNLWVRDGLIVGLTQILNQGLSTDGLSVSDYFNIEFIRDGFIIDNYEVEVIPTDNLHAGGMLSMGVKINDISGNKNIIFTSDIAKFKEAQFDGYFDRYTVALFHDVSVTPNNVHANIDDVVQYYKNKIDLNKIYGMHYQDDVNLDELKGKFGIKFVEKDKVYEF